METTKTRQQSILTFALKTSPAINVEASNSCSEAELRVVFSSSYHTLILAYTALRVRSFK